MTSYNGKTITYNANGGVASYDGWNYTWNKGKLSGISKISIGSIARAPAKPITTSTKNYTFAYNAFGQRISSQYSHTWTSGGLSPIQPGDVTSYNKNYTYDSTGRLIEEVINGERYVTGSFTNKLRYLYDANGMVGVEYTNGANTDAYYYLRNLLGDVVAIYDSNGVRVVEYAYDAWGNCTVKGTTSNYNLAYDNPIRYRGYYYDADTNLYYLNARYYSPEFRRFISPDKTSYLDSENVNGLNLYCYCGNDPINYADPSGCITLEAAIIAFCIGAVLGAIYGGISAAANGQNVWIGMAIGAAVGGVTGLITEAASVPTMLVLTFFVGAGGDVLSQLFLEQKSWQDINVNSALWAGLSNALLAGVGKGISKGGNTEIFSRLESILFGTMTNSPLLALGMVNNMIISKHSTVYTFNDLNLDVNKILIGEN